MIDPNNGFIDNYAASNDEADSTIFSITDQSYLQFLDNGVFHFTTQSGDSGSDEILEFLAMDAASDEEQPLVECAITNSALQCENYKGGTVITLCQTSGGTIVYLGAGTDGCSSLTLTAVAA